MVSVIIPSHNSDKTLSKAIRSVLGQSYHNFEILVIDNGSKVPPVLEEDIASDPRVKLYVEEEALGAAGARNRGIDLAKGDFIAFLDSDDFWAPDKLDKQLKVMEKFEVDGKLPDICFSGRRIVNESGENTGHYIGCKKVVTFKSLLTTNQINCSSVLVRRSALEGHRFPEDAGKDIHEDYVMWLSILKDGGYAAGIDKPLIMYRKSHESKSGNKFRSAIMNYRVYKYMGLGWFSCIKYMVTYTVLGIKKHTVSF
jgi:teichuronic acid biosynthesis glycosyltransferase TuaG